MLYFNIISFLRVVAAAATDCVSQSRCSMLEICIVWVCDIFKFTSLKIFTPIPITFWGQISFIKFLVTFWLENFTGTQSGQSIFWRPNELIFKTCLHTKYPFESSFQNNLFFYDWVSNENFMAKILTGCQADRLGT